MEDNLLDEIEKEEELYGQFEELTAQEALNYPCPCNTSIPLVDDTRSLDDTQILENILSDIQQIHNNLSLQNMPNNEKSPDSYTSEILADTPQNKQFQLNPENPIETMPSVEPATQDVPAEELTELVDTTITPLEEQHFSVPLELEPSQEDISSFSTTLENLNLDALAMPSQERFNDVDIDIPVEDFPVTTPQAEQEPLEPVCPLAEEVLAHEDISPSAALDPKELELLLTGEEKVPSKEPSLDRVEVAAPADEERVDILAEKNLSQIIPMDEGIVASELISLPKPEELVDILSRPVDESKLTYQDMNTVLPVGPMFDISKEPMPQETIPEVEVPVVPSTGPEEPSETIASEIEAPAVPQEETPEQNNADISMPAVSILKDNDAESYQSEAQNDVADQVLSQEALAVLEKTALPLEAPEKSYNPGPVPLDDMASFVALFEKTLALLPDDVRDKLKDEKNYVAYCRIKDKLEQMAVPATVDNDLMRYCTSAKQRGRVPLILELNKEILLDQVIHLSEDEVNINEIEKEWYTFLKDFLAGEGFVINDALHTTIVSSRSWEMPEQDYLDALIRQASDVFGVQPDESLFEPFFYPITESLLASLSVALQQG